MMLILILFTILLVPSSVYPENATTVPKKNPEMPTIIGAPAAPAASSQGIEASPQTETLSDTKESKNSSLIIIKNVQTKSTNGADLANQQLHEISQEKTNAQKNDKVSENSTPSRKVTDTGFGNNSMPTNKKAAIVAEGVSIKLTSNKSETSNETLQLDVKQINQNKTESKQDNHDDHEAKDKMNLNENKDNKTEKQENPGKTETNSEIPEKASLNMTLSVDGQAKNSNKTLTNSSPQIQANSTILSSTNNGTLPNSSSTTTTKTTTTTTTTTPKPKKPKVTYSTEDHQDLDAEVLKQKNLEAAAAGNGQKDYSKLPIAEPPIVQPSQEMNSDYPYENGRDYIVPVITIIFCIPLAIGIIITAYRRFRDFWSTRHYRRMDFLVDGMYND